MVDFDEVFGDRKAEKRHDVIKELIFEMEKSSNEEDFEHAKYILNKIKEFLKLPDNYDYIFTPSKLGDIQTLKDIDEILKRNSIRLNPKHYSLSDWLNLLQTLEKRKGELQGHSYKDIERTRKIVAEEMLYVKMIVPKKERGVGKMPNRAFLDILYSTHPDLCRQEIGRREKVKLWKAIESGNKQEIQKAKEEISKYSIRGE